MTGLMTSQIPSLGTLPLKPNVGARIYFVDSLLKILKFIISHIQPVNKAGACAGSSILAVWISVVTKLARGSFIHTP